MSKTNGTRKKYALVTGAGTGLGFATAKLMASKGWEVYGTHLPSQSPDEMKRHRVIPVVMDVTDEGSIKAGYERLSKEVADAGLATLVNVAGLAEIAGGVIEGVPMDRIKALFEVNVFGTLRVIQTFLPALRAHGPARIVNVSSTATRIPIPFTGIYAISKFAIMGITNSLRFELAPFGIQVTSIEPGAMDTPMTADHQANLEKTWSRMPPHVNQLYRPKLGPTLAAMRDGLEKADPPDVLADVIYKALQAKNMKMRYVGGRGTSGLVTMQNLLGENLSESLIKRALKLNPVS
jgi:NAD(P)-dependent dehydrogenase (short-subunit alcohol dehydrogenase family)